MTARALTIAAVLVLVVSGCARPVEESALARGKRLFDEGKWDPAIEALGEAITLNPLDSEAYLYRGRAYHCRGPEHLSQAIADFNEAIHIRPKSFEAYYSRSEAYKDKGDREKSLSDALTARRLDPNYTAASGMYSSSTGEEFQKVLQRSVVGETSTAATGKAPADASVESATEDSPSPSSLVEDSTPAVLGKTEPKSRRPDSAATELRDDHGLPLSTERSGSVTEELFGVGRGRSDVAAGSDSTRLPSTGSLPRKSMLPPEWRTTTPQPAPLPLETPTPKAASRPSPIGTLPFGNPYQPRGGYSPYTPIGPRSTGLRGDPIYRQPQSPYYDPRINPYVPLPRVPGPQGPFVPPQ